MKEQKERVHITMLQVQDFMKIKALQLPIEGPLTVIGGKCDQGKTSAVRALKWGLGGNRYKPDSPNRKDKLGEHEADIEIKLSNGMSVKVAGKNGTISVYQPDGKKSGVMSLGAFVSTFALDLPDFMAASATEQAKRLLESFPEEASKLNALSANIESIYAKREEVGRDYTRKKKHAEDLPHDTGAPRALQSGTEITDRLKAALSVNAQNEAIRKNKAAIAEEWARCTQEGRRIEDRIKQLKDDIAQAMDDQKANFARGQKAVNDLAVAEKTIGQLKDEDETAIKHELEEIESLNARFRNNETRSFALDEADRFKAIYDEKTLELELVRGERLALLNAIQWPLDGLSIDEQARLCFNGAPWDSMSGSQQLRVATAVCSRLSPTCGFVFLDNLEALDLDVLQEYAQWCEANDMKVIGTRVSVGEECSIVIQDGEAVEGDELEQLRSNGRSIKF